MPHGHGFISLANVYQHHNLEQIGSIIESNYNGITPEAMLDRVKKFVAHLQREDHMDNEQHQNNVDKFESDFQTNNAGPDENIHLSVRSARFYTCSSSPYAWSCESVARAADGDEESSMPEYQQSQIEDDANAFERAYKTDVQFIRTASPNTAGDIVQARSSTSWGRLEIIWGRLGALLSRLGAVLEGFGTVFGRRWKPPGASGSVGSFRTT